MTVIRNAGDADLDEVRLLLREYAAYLNASVGDEHICLENYEKELATLPSPYQAPNGVILLAMVDARAAGVAALKPLKLQRSAVPGERPCEMKRLWVRPEFRGLGLGRRLCDALIEQARTLGYTSIYLDTMPATMRGANRIYMELGFVPVERYGDNPILRQPVDRPDNSSPEVMFFRRELAR
jgi:putative acetyltransferase